MPHFLDVCAARLRGVGTNVLTNLAVNWVTYLLVAAAAYAGSYFSPNDPGGTTADPSAMPCGYEALSFVSSSFQDVEDELEDNVSLEFDPPGLRRIRFCGDANFPANRKKGDAHLAELLGRLNGCLERSDKEANGEKIISITAGDGGYEKVERRLGNATDSQGRKERLHFCNCKPQTIKYIQQNPWIP